MSEWHRMNGIFMALGPEIKRHLNRGARILDLAPTILHIMGVLIPSDMDGRILPEIFKPNGLYLARKKVESQFK